MKKIILTTLFVVSLLLIMCISASAAQYVSLTPVDFPIVVNGNKVDNNSREYPFIFYNSITYFPMTYEDCALLGVENTWTAETGNILTKTTPSGQYRSYISPVDCEVAPGTLAMIAENPITVMGNLLNNTAEQYPVLNYKNVLYFPLTYSWGQAFGWTIDFHPNRTLEVTTADFEKKGSYFIYKIDGDAIETIECSVTDESKNRFYNNDEATNSPDYTFGYCAKNGFIPVYRFLPSNNKLGKRIMSVNASVLPLFEQYGWFAASNPYGAIAKFAETESKYEIEDQLQFFIHYISGKPGAEIDALKEITSYVLRNYTTLYASNGRVCSVLNADVSAYNAVGWTDANTYIKNVVWQNESVGNHYGALRILEYFTGCDDGTDLKTALPYIRYYEIDDEISTKREQLREYIGSRQKQAVVFGHTSMDDFGNYSITFRTKGDYIEQFDISYQVVDTAGKVIGSFMDSIYGDGVRGYDSIQHYIDNKSIYNFGGVKNVSVYNIKFYDPEYFNMGLGKG